MAFQIKKKKQKVKKIDGLFYIGQQQHQAGDLQQAEAFYNKVLEINPNYANAIQALGVIRFQTGRLQEAIELINKSLSINPNCAEAYNNLGNIFEELGKLEDAKECYDRSLLINPKLVNAHYNLGNLYKTLGKFDRVKDCYREALKINPNYEDSYNGLGVMLVGEGKLAEGFEYYKKLLKINPNYVIAYDNLLLGLNYHSKTTPEYIYQEHLEFAKQYTDKLKSFIKIHTNSLNSNKRLRVGFVSSDFRNHSVFYFLRPVFKNYDTNKFEFFCYSNSTTKDLATVELQTYVYNWRTIYGMPDEKICGLIRQDQIDVLIDLNGHTADNKLFVFARKPAPIQITWLGYPNTTGLDTIGYRIVDSFTDPEGLTDKFNTEKLIRMPECFSCYSSIVDSPEVNELPALKNGYITFGSFNNFSKVTSDVIEVWAKILKAVPNSKLILKNNLLSGSELQNDIKGLFEHEGISSDRLELIGYDLSQQDHLFYYNKVDIGLDPFPYNGATTSCDSLWMGVPIITLAGNSHVSRVGVSQLMNIGLPDFIAKDKDEYVRIAQSISQKLAWLQTVRVGLRQIMSSSSLMNGERFTKHLEIELRKVWSDYVNFQLTDEKKNKPRRLHIGGQESKEGWEVLNTIQAPCVDHLGNASNLSRFGDKVFTEIYASHIAEHLDYTNELFLSLKEWNRVLRSGGKLYISVPDMDVLAKLYLDKGQLNFDERFMVMRMMFGGHIDMYDYHVVGLNEELLTIYLENAGFVNIKRVDNFNIFNDTSSMVYKDVPISLNLIAEK